MKRLVLVVALLAGCQDSGSQDNSPIEVAGTVVPPKVTAFGHELLTVTTGEPFFSADSVITIEGHAVYDLTIDNAHKASFRWQGAEAESAHIDVQRNGKAYRISQRLHVAQPPHPAFKRMVSIGASFGQGVQSVSFDQDTAMHAPAAQVARQAGAFFPMPLTKRGYIPALEPQDFNGSCNGPDLGEKEVRNLDNALAGFQDLQGRLSPEAIRIDPNIKVQNAAVGGQVIDGVLHGAEKVEPVITLLEHLIYDPVTSWDDMLRAPEIGSEVDYVLTLEPTMWMAVDLIGNDMLPAFSGHYRADRVPDDKYFRDNFTELFARIGKDAYVFVADLPDITRLPDERIKRLERITNGEYTEAEIDANLELGRQRMREINAILAEAAKPYPKVTIVKFSELVDKLALTGLDAGGQHLSFDNYGGFISLDGLHLSNTGYGVLANLFIEAMNQKLGTKIPLADIDALVKADRYSPAALTPYGLSVTACPTP